MGWKAVLFIALQIKILHCRSISDSSHQHKIDDTSIDNIADILLPLLEQRLGQHVPEVQKIIQLLPFNNSELKPWKALKHKKHIVKIMPLKKGQTNAVALILAADTSEHEDTNKISDFSDRSINFEDFAKAADDYRHFDLTEEVNQSDDDLSNISDTSDHDSGVKIYPVRISSKNDSDYINTHIVPDEIVSDEDNFTEENLDTTKKVIESNEIYAVTSKIDVNENLDIDFVDNTSEVAHSHNIGFIDHWAVTDKQHRDSSDANDSYENTNVVGKLGVISENIVDDISVENNGNKNGIQYSKEDVSYASKDFEYTKDDVSYISEDEGKKGYIYNTLKTNQDHDEVVDDSRRDNNFVNKEDTLFHKRQYYKKNINTEKSLISNELETLNNKKDLIPGKINHIIIENDLPQRAKQFQQLDTNYYFNDISNLQSNHQIGTHHIGENDNYVVKTSDNNGDISSIADIQSETNHFDGNTYKPTRIDNFIHINSMNNNTEEKANTHNLGDKNPMIHVKSTPNLGIVYHPSKIYIHSNIHNSGNTEHQRVIDNTENLDDTPSYTTSIHHYSDKPHFAGSISNGASETTGTLDETLKSNDLDIYNVGTSPESNDGDYLASLQDSIENPTNALRVKSSHDNIGLTAALEDLLQRSSLPKEDDYKDAKLKDTAPRNFSHKSYRLSFRFSK